MEYIILGVNIAFGTIAFSFFFGVGAYIGIEMGERVIQWIDHKMRPKRKWWHIHD